MHMEISNVINNQMLNRLPYLEVKAASAVVEPISWQALNLQVAHFLQSTWQMLPALALGIVAIIVCYLLARPLSYLLVWIINP